MVMSIQVVLPGDGPHCVTNEADSSVVRDAESNASLPKRRQVCEKWADSSAESRVRPGGPGFHAPFSP